MRNVTKRVLALAVPAIFCLCSCPSSFAAELRLAVIPGEGKEALNPAVISAVEVVLSDEHGISLVERQSIQRILDEQHLTLSGLADPATAAKVGNLLNAQMLLLVSSLKADAAAARPGQEQGGTVQLRAGETRTSIIPGSAIREEKDLANADAASARPEQKQGNIVQLRAVETRTGIILGSAIHTENDVEKTLAW